MRLLKKTTVVILVCLLLFTSGCANQVLETKPVSTTPQKVTIDPVNLVEANIEDLYEVAFSYDGKLIAIIKYHESISFLSRDGTNGWELVHSIDKPGVTHMSWSPTDLRICLSYPGKLEILDLSTRESVIVREIDTPYSPHVVWSKNGELIASSMPARSLVEGDELLAQVYDTGSLNVLRKYQTATNNSSGSDFIDWNPENNDADIMMLRQGAGFTFINKGSSYRIEGINVIAGLGYNGIHWIDDDRFILIANELNLPDDREKIRMILTSSAKISTEYIVVAEGKGAEPAQIISSVYLPGQKFLATISKTQLFNLYQIEDNSIILCLSQKLNEINVTSHLTFDPSNGKLYLYDGDELFSISIL
jgi:hypothetical protein